MQNRTESTFTSKRRQNRYEKEQASIEALDLLMGNFGKEAFLNLYKRIVKHSKIAGVECAQSWLFTACKKNYLRLAEKLIECGAPINEGTVCKENTFYDNMSPLMIASRSGHEQIVVLLLKNQADLLHVSGMKSTALMVSKTKGIANMLLEQAKESACFEKLLSMQDNQDDTVFDYAVFSRNIPFIKELMCIDNWHDYANLSRFLHWTRLASWEHPKDYDEYNEICSIIRSKLPTIGNSIIELDTHALSQSLETSYEKLFGEGDCRQTIVDSEESALKVMLAEVYSLLATPEACFDYLDLLNKELDRYFDQSYKKLFPVLDPSSYTMKVIDGTYYPIPNPTFDVHLQKHKTLQQVLMALFREYGLAYKAFQWIGFMPHEIADKMVRDGDFFEESVFGPGLCHGPLAHMVQQAIIIYAIEKKAIHMDFTIAGKQRRFLVKELLAAFVNIKIKDANVAAWNPIRDNRHFNDVAFVDPHRLISILMHDGHRLGWPSLANSLRASFRRGYLALLKAYEDILPVLKQTPEAFAEQLNDLVSPIFNTPENLIKYAIDRARKKGLWPDSDMFSYGEYAAIPLKYEIKNTYFEARHCGLFSQSGHAQAKRDSMGLNPEVFSFSSEILYKYCKFKMNSNPAIVVQVFSTPELRNKLSDYSQLKILELNPAISHALCNKGKYSYTQSGAATLYAPSKTTAKEKVARREDRIEQRSIGELVKQFDCWMKDYVESHKSKGDYDDNNKALINWLNADRGAKYVRTYTQFCELAALAHQQGYATNPPPVESEFNKGIEKYSEYEKYQKQHGFKF